MSAARFYIHPNAQRALDDAERAANLSPVVVQTLGNAPQSAGFHAADGTYLLSNGHHQEYCAAVDWSVHQPAKRLSDGKGVTMDTTHIRWWLYNLAAHGGFVAWYRRPAQGFDASHIHGVYVGVAMKPQLQAQCRDFFSGKDGLRSHRKEEFWTHPEELDAALKKLFDEHN